jgi:agmatinase
MAGNAFPYASSSTFLGVPARDGSRSFAVAGIPWDGAVTNRSGAREGPEAIRRASRMLCDATHPHFDCSPLGALTDLGDIAFPNTGLEAMRSAIASQAPAILERHHACWLGGDHSITLPLLRAYRARVGRPLGLVHFDAHCDTWPDHFGEPSGHGTWLREAIAEGLVEPRAVVQLGIRSPATRSVRALVDDSGGRAFTARELRGMEGPAQLAPVLDEIRERLRAAGDPPTYLTLDIDCLDPAFAPGTGTPEAGGLTTAQVLTVLEELSELPWAGMDCVEVAPAYDHAEATALAAATFVWTYLAGRLAQR